MKEKMLKFLNESQLPLYYEEKECIKEFIETFFNHNQPERSKREDVNSKEALMDNPFIKDSTECFINDAVL